MIQIIHTVSLYYTIHFLSNNWKMIVCIFYGRKCASSREHHTHFILLTRIFNWNDKKNHILIKLLSLYIFCVTIENVRCVLHGNMCSFSWSSQIFLFCLKINSYNLIHLIKNMHIWGLHHYTFSLYHYAFSSVTNAKARCAYRGTCVRPNHKQFTLF